MSRPHSSRLSRPAPCIHALEVRSKARAFLFYSPLPPKKPPLLHWECVLDSLSLLSSFHISRSGRDNLQHRDGPGFGCACSPRAPRRAAAAAGRQPAPPRLQTERVQPRCTQQHIPP